MLVESSIIINHITNNLNIEKNFPKPTVRNHMYQNQNLYYNQTGYKKVNMHDRHLKIINLDTNEDDNLS